MNKDCQPAPTVRTRRTSKKQASTKRTAALEEKIDGLVQMLQRSQAVGSEPNSPQMSTASHNIGSLTFTDRTLVASSDPKPGNLNPEPYPDGITIDSMLKNPPPENPAENTLSSGSFGVTQADESSGFFQAKHELLSLAMPSLGNMGCQFGRDGTILNPPPGNNPSPPSTEQDSVASQAKNTCIFQGEQQRHYCGFNPPLTPASSSTNHPLPSSSFNYPLETEEELEQYLETYRTKMVPYFPVVCIRPDVTMASLRNSRPFLFLVIRTICNKNLHRQQALVVKVKIYISQEMILEGNKNLDLLLGLLVFGSWFHISMHEKRPIISTVSYLSLSIASDLGLTKPPYIMANPMKQYINQGFTNPVPLSHLLPSAMFARSMEERRTAVGVFLATSV